jgi:hypothetical protein
MMAEAPDTVRSITTSAGTLESCESWTCCFYLRWLPGQEKAQLDGYFTSAELRAIADHMDEHPEAGRDGDVG